MKRLLYRASVHTLGSLPPPPSDSMFARAIQESQAKPPAAKAGTNIALHIPSTSSLPSHGGNIVEQLKKARPQSSAPGGPTAASSSVTAFAASNGLKTRHANTVQNFQTSRIDHGRRLASLYGASASFEEEPDVTRPAQAPPPPSTVYFEVDDFSDDEKLDLDLEFPSALPSFPTPRKPVKHGDEPTSTSSRLSWSQSSPSHYVDPKRRNAEPLNQSMKRKSPSENMSFPIPAPKKRLSPPRRPASRGNGEEPPNAPALATPATKSARSLPWDTTASAVKAQKKQLKSQHNKKPSPSELAPPVDDGHESRELHGAPAKASAISLSSEQCHVKNLACSRNVSVFFTGPAGTGKSVLMKVIIQEMMKRYARETWEACNNCFDRAGGVQHRRYDASQLRRNRAWKGGRTVACEKSQAEPKGQGTLAANEDAHH